MSFQEVFAQHWIILLTAAAFIGMDKGGLKPLTLVATFLLTTAIGPRMTLAVTAPIMFIGDLFPIYIYRKHIQFRCVGKFLIPAGIGLAAGALIGSSIDEHTFKVILGAIILILAVMLIVQDLNILGKKKISGTVPRILLGVSAGFSSIIGNAAGGFSSVFFLSQTTTKEGFIGSSSAFLSALSSTKFLIYIFGWHVVTPCTLTLSAVMIPVILLATLLTTVIIRYIPQRLYHVVILASILYAGVSLVVN